MLRLIQLARVQFLLAGFALYLFGALLALLAGAPFSPGRLLLGCLIVLPAQLSVNFSNDYFDVESDQLEGATFISGGSSILLRYPQLREPARRIALGLMLFSLAMAVVFALIYEVPLRMLGLVVLGNILGWTYSAPPFRLSSRGLGEIVLTFVAGFLLPATGYLSMRGAMDGVGAAFLFPLLCYGLVFILSVEIPDLEVDRQGGKQTWVARTGRRFGFTAVGCLLLASTGYFFVLHALITPSLSLDYRIVGWLSLLPLLPGLWGLLRQPVDRQPATRIATAIVINLALFAVLLDLYLLFLVFY